MRLGVKIMQFIVDNDIREFADLAEYCLIHNEVWDDYLAKSTYYIKSMWRLVDIVLEMLSCLCLRLKKNFFGKKKLLKKDIGVLDKKDDKNVIDKPLEG